ncbi:sensor histidine kinase [Arthrobacter globiformis]|uniref:sensor histidine kinase n=1 Tax=Arthrobacter globiformis TaxID=1665 RepID=UPI0027D77932|nr:sensor histidine kinase [Arthrobacter globiformis]
MVAAAAVFHPETLADPRFRLALLAHTALFVLSVAVPWGRLPAAAYAVIPALDCVAIGFTREAGGPNFNVLSLLLVFPVVWLSVDRNRAGVVLAVAATVLSTVLPAAALGTLPTQGSLIRTIFLCSIADTGIGMDAQEQERAFTRFFRSARSRETAIPGAGLGLPVSKTIVEGHGGSISLRSAPGKGTTVTVSLPSPEAASPEAPYREPASAAAESMQSAHVNWQHAVGSE